ncbi:ribonuclease H-like domain-containing protein [Tanacetum coccineum]
MSICANNFLLVYWKCGLLLSSVVDVANISMMRPATDAVLWMLQVMHDCVGAAILMKDLFYVPIKKEVSMGCGVGRYEPSKIVKDEGVKGTQFFIEADVKGPTLRLDNTRKTISIWIPKPGVAQASVRDTLINECLQVQEQSPLHSLVICSVAVGNARANLEASLYIGTLRVFEGQVKASREETYENTSPEKPALVDAEAKAVHMILNGIGNDIYSTVDAGLNDKEMWIEIEQLLALDLVDIGDIVLLGIDLVDLWVIDLVISLLIALSSEDLISILDLGNPLHLQNSDFNANAIIFVKLTGTENYRIFSDNAVKVWAELKETYDKLNGLTPYGREFDIMTKLPKCSCAAREDVLKHNQLMKLMKFLMGLNEVFQLIRSSLLSRENLPDVKDAFLLFPKRNLIEALPLLLLLLLLPGLYLNLRKVGHTVDRCFDLIGYPPGYNKNPEPKQNCYNRTFNAKAASTSNDNGTSLSFTNEQIMKLINIINEVPSDIVQANMTCRGSFFNNSGANQHMTISTTNMFGIIDISDLNLTVGHPNGTLAKIKYVGNLRLYKNVVLFDVLVFLEYRVSLLSINKLIRDSKQFAGFTESKCYIQDLHLNKIMGIGSENGGVYMFDFPSLISSNCQTLDNLTATCFVSKSVWHNRLGHPSDQAVDVLQSDLKFIKDSHVSPCGICHKAKQTREHFPLSDHMTTVIGELVHIDLFGPYKVISKDGFRYFITIVDDWAVWIYLIKTKDEVYGLLVNFINLIHNQFKYSIKNVRFDNGTEFVNNKMNELFSSLGIFHQTSCAYTPQQNEVAERKHKHLLNMARSLSEKCVLIGFSTTKKAYKFYSLESKLMFYSRDVKFYETVFPFKMNSSLQSVEENHDDNINNLNFFDEKHLDDQTSSSSPNVDGRVNFTPNDEGNVFPWTRSTQTSDGSEDNIATSMGENTSSEGTVPSSSGLNAQNLPENTSQVQPDVRRTGRNVKFPARFNDYVVGSRRKVVGSKWLFKIKYKSSGAIDRYKAMLVAKGFSKRDGFDNMETFSPVVKMSIVRCMLNGAMCNNWDLFQLDINNAFLYGDLCEDVYMTLPLSKFDYSLFTKKYDKVFITLLVYVDDIVITGNDLAKIKKFKIFLNLLVAKHVDTPLFENTTLNHIETDDDHLLDNIRNYKKLVGKLIYLTNTRPDISYVVPCLSQYMHAHLVSHLDAAMRVLRYLKGSPGRGIQINKSGNLKLRAYADSDWARCPATRKYVSGYCVFLGDSLVTWKSKKQSTLSKSFVEAEYRSMASATCEVIWLSNLLGDMGVKNLLPVVMYCDNSSALQIAANPVFHEKSKHFEIDVYLVREKVFSGVIKTEKIHTSQQIADVLMKTLDIEQPKILCDKLGMLDMFKVEKLEGGC